MHIFLTMHDTIQLTQPYAPNLSRGQEHELQHALQNDSLFSYSGVDLDAMTKWLLMPSEVLLQNDSLSVRNPFLDYHQNWHEAFYPPLPNRTWTEKQYTPLSVSDRWRDNAPTRSVVFAVLMVAALLSVYLRFRFWKYYTEYAKLLFHPRSLQRVCELDAPHLPQFHLIIDFTNILSLSLLLWNALHLSLLHSLLGISTSLWTLAITFFVFLLYYVLRFLVLRMASYLIKQTQAAQLIWRQHFFIHRILWPYYLMLALLVFCKFSVVSQAVLYMAVVLVILATLYAQVRVLLTFIYFHFNLFYYFLYLCALGIAPWLGLVRWFQLV